MSTTRTIEIISQWEDIRGRGAQESPTPHGWRIAVAMLDELRDEIRKEQDEESEQK